MVCDMLARMRREMADDSSGGGVAAAAVAPEMDSLLLLDRSLDLLSVMAVQKTYEGLVAEVFGIANGHTWLEAELVAVDEDRNKKLPPLNKIPLNSDDEVFAHIRDCNEQALGSLLGAKAREFADFERKKDELASMPMVEIQHYVKRLK